MTSPSRDPADAERHPVPHQEEPLPRPKRRPRRARSDRGLPPDEELRKLAVAYLDRQRKHWPRLVAAGLLPEASDTIVAQMVADFKERHRTCKVDLAGVLPFLKFCPRLGGSYNRYSCDNSSPTSILDQLVNALDKAHAEDRFIPWAFVFADYSVTGLDPSRQGYTSFKKVLAGKDNMIETVYIDDFTRASRDELEWWRLAALAKRLGKRMIGASDGFDVNNPNWDIHVTMYGLLSRMFIKSLREKVKRGMRGAARRGTCLGKLPLGFTRCVHRDQDGNTVHGPDGQPLYQPCIDPETRDYRVLMYELFVVKKWTAFKIVRHFNKLKVDGWDNWTEAAVKKLLWSPSAIGVFIWNKTRREYDYEAGKWVVVQNPRQDWVVHYDRDLAIIPMEWYRAARRRLADMRRRSPLTGRKRSRNQCSATTLFSGTLFCASCGAEIKLIRSAGKYKQMGCFNGITGAHDCTLSTSKSTRQVEECLLTYLRNVILNEAQIEELIARANVFLQEEAQKPQVNTAPMKAKVRQKEARIAKLVRQVEEIDNEALTQGFSRRIVELQKEVNQLHADIRAAEARNQASVKPLDMEHGRAYLANIHDLLCQAIPVAAEAIRSLTGPIKIRQEPILGLKRRARWIATFSPDLLGILRIVAGNGSTGSLLASGDAVPAQPVEVVIEKVPQYELLAAKFKKLHDEGTSINTIASVHGMPWQTAADILHFAETGERPKFRCGKRTGTGPGKPCRFKDIAEEVVHLRDRKKMSFARIAVTLGVYEGTVRRAYDHVHPEIVRQAAERGEKPCRGRYSHLGQEKYDLIHQLLDEGKKPAEVAAQVGCGTSTVNRVLAQKKQEA